MINNLQNQLSNYFNNKNSKTEAGGAADAIKRLKEKQDAARGVAAEGTEEESAEQTQDKQGKLRLQRPASLDTYTPFKSAKLKNQPAAAATQPQTAAEETKEEDAAAQTAAQDSGDKKLSAEERRQAELKKIMEKLDAEEAQKYPNRVKDKQADKTSGVISPETAGTASSGGFENFLNEMPLFNEFKSGLIDAFKSLDSATSGSISAQYELNYSTMQYVAAEGGGYEYKETNLSIKLDLNYVKAAGGGQDAKDIISALENAEDFESLVSSLQGLATQQGTGTDAAQQTQGNGKGLSALTGLSKEELKEALTESLKSYWSPESTSGRIVDFATMFFPMSSEFKDGGDTEEARQAFADRMGKAIQKGFDQALGTLGKLPKNTSDEIAKTHELTFKGLEDFVKNGLNKQKEEEGVYDSLSQFAMSFQMSYSEKTVSVSGYNSKGQAQTAAPSSLNTEA